MTYHNRISRIVSNIKYSKYLASILSAVGRAPHYNLQMSLIRLLQGLNRSNYRPLGGQLLQQNKQKKMSPQKEAVHKAAPGLCHTRKDIHLSSPCGFTTINPHITFTFL